MSDKLKTVVLRTYDNPMEANLAKARLEEAGIMSVVAGENVTMVLPSLNTNTSGIRLSVDESDYVRAGEILAEEIIQNDDSEFWKIKCQHCGSDNVTKVNPIKQKFSWSRLLKTILLISDTSKQAWDLYFCENCKKEFRLSDAIEGETSF